MVNYYEILELTKIATESDIKKAYKKLALKWHPDKNPDKIKEATRRFTDICAAYEVLSDEKKRKIYDQKQQQPTRAHHSTSPKTTTSSSNRRAYTRTNKSSAFTSPPFSPVFDDFFTFKSPEQIFKEFFGQKGGSTTPKSSRFGSNIIGESQRQAAANAKSSRNFMSSFMWDPFGNDERTATASRSKYNTANGEKLPKSKTTTVTTFKDGKAHMKKVILDNNIETTYRYVDDELVSKTVKAIIIL